ncbi:MAG: NRDE family protein [Planctomycetota bacterium]|jgi:uncharacterized protein with NRDE domain
MCLILFSWQTHPEYPLVVLANRDEFYDRPAAHADWWEDAPSIWAGRDLEAGGTWMGVTREGRFAALTNYREPGKTKPDAPSRGELVADFLRSEASPEAHLPALRASGAACNGFNLLFGVGERLGYHSNRGAESVGLSPGIYGLSNHLLDTPWPKVRRGKEGLADVLRAADGPEGILENAFALLSDASVAPDVELPDTGVGLELERLLSPMHIESSLYGTRASTVLIRNRAGRFWLEERSRGSGKPRRASF